MRKVVVMGLGYIGLPTACLIASKKIKVLGVDVNQEVMNLTNQGRANGGEPDLAGLLKKAVDEGYLKVDTKPDYADIFIIHVPTPCKDVYKPDISYVETAINSIISYIKNDNLIPRFGKL